MKIAKFKSMEYGYESFGAEDGLGSIPDSFVRLTEYADVELTPLPEVDVINAQITVLRDVQNNIRAAATKKVEDIEEQIQKLLALPDLRE